MAHRDYRFALQDFQAARKRAALEEVIALVSGKSNDLLDYHDVARRLKLKSQVDRGEMTIPVAAIIGSVGRCTEFTRTFLPKHASDRERWARVKSVLMAPKGESLPPIEVYKVGGAYFVLDGNHRVSIARQEGVEFIDAHVIEMRTPIPMDPDVQPDDLIIKAEHADFLDITGIDQAYPNVDFSVSVPGQYEKLLLQIEILEYRLSENYPQGISFADAVHAWFETVYSPLADAIHERGLMRWFHNRTVTDMFIWIMEYRRQLENEIGWSISPDAAVSSLVVKTSSKAERVDREPGSWREAHLVDRYTESLFTEVLVPISGKKDGWEALEQAVIIGQRDGARLQGLHVVGTRTKKNSVAVKKIQSQFKNKCEEHRLDGNLIVEVGEISDRIIKRAVLADLIVLKVNHPPRKGLALISSPIRTIITHSSRPIMAIPGNATPINNVLLAFDGSPKAKEALFVSAYVAEKWKTGLTVFCSIHENKDSDSCQDYARAYLDLHEISADYILTTGPVSELVHVVSDRKINLVLAGGYSGPAVVNMVMGSTLDFLLRELPVPILICR